MGKLKKIVKSEILFHAIHWESEILVSMSQECAVLVRLQQVLLICILNNKIKKKQQQQR